jgi:hypothetical protein
MADIIERIDDAMFNAAVAGFVPGALELAPEDHAAFERYAERYATVPDPAAHTPRYRDIPVHQVRGLLSFMAVHVPGQDVLLTRRRLSL